MGDSYRFQTGIGSVGSYQISGIPWATSSVAAPIVTAAPLVIEFPTVTKFIVIKNIATTDVQLRVGFSENGVKNGNYFILNRKESFEGDLRVTRLYLLSDETAVTVPVTIVAGLTGIQSDNLPYNWSGSAGVG